MTFLWSDAWILTAVAVASRQGPAELWQILAAADAIESSLPLDEELHGAFVRLASQRYLGEFVGKFMLGPGIPREMRATLASSAGTDYKEAEKFLSSEPRQTDSGVGDERNQVRYPNLTSDQIREADKRYRRWVREEANRITRQP